MDLAEVIVRLQTGSCIREAPRGWQRGPLGDRLPWRPIPIRDWCSVRGETGGACPVSRNGDGRSSSSRAGSRRRDSRAWMDQDHHHRAAVGPDGQQDLQHDQCPLSHLRLVGATRLPAWGRRITAAVASPSLPFPVSLHLGLWRQTRSEVWSTSLRWPSPLRRQLQPLPWWVEPCAPGHQGAGRSRRVVGCPAADGDP
jgi:hypothetical protein